MEHQSLSETLEARIVRPAILTVIGYLVLLLVGYIATLFGVGPWFSLILIFANIAYVEKLNNGKKRLVKEEFVPVFVTAGLAYLLQDSVDYAFAIVAVIVLFCRVYSLYVEHG